MNQVESPRLRTPLRDRLTPDEWKRMGAMFGFIALLHVGGVLLMWRATSGNYELADGSLLVQQKQDLGEVARQISQLELSLIPLATLQSRTGVLRGELKKIEEEFDPYLRICFRRSPQDLERELQAIKTDIAKADARIAELKARR